MFKDSETTNSEFSRSQKREQINKSELYNLLIGHEICKKSVVESNTDLQDRY